MTPGLRVDHPVSGVTALRLDRPNVANALNLALVSELQSHIAGIDAEPATRAVLLTSTTPGMFCGGADLKVADSERAMVSDQMYVLYEQMIALRVPIIAAVDGAAVGGGAQLALASDVRLGSPRARFQFPGAGHGLSVGSWALPSTVGRRGLELVLSQRFVAAEESQQLGLLDRLVEQAEDESAALAHSVTQLDGDAVGRAKHEVTQHERLHERLAAERSGNGATFTGRVTNPRE